MTIPSPGESETKVEPLSAEEEKLWRTWLQKPRWRERFNAAHGDALFRLIDALRSQLSALQADDRFRAWVEAAAKVADCYSNAAAMHIRKLSPPSPADTGEDFELIAQQAHDIAELKAGISDMQSERDIAQARALTAEAEAKRWSDAIAWFETYDPEAAEQIRARAALSPPPDQFAAREKGTANE